MGSGQVAKMINQVLVLNNFVIIAEALALAEAGGIDSTKLPAALASGHAGSNLLPILLPKMAARDYQPKGYARQILKDFEAVNKLAKKLKTAIPMSKQAMSLFRELVMRSYGELDGAAIFKIYDREVNLGKENNG